MAKERAKIELTCAACGDKLIIDKDRYVAQGKLGQREFRHRACYVKSTWRTPR